MSRRVTADMRRAARGGARIQSEALVTPDTFASLINLWDAADYTAGSWPAAYGSRADTLTQGNASKQPTANASVAAFNNKPTVQWDGTADNLNFAGAALPVQPYTIITVQRINGSAGNAYMYGGYFTSGYNFYLGNASGDTLGLESGALINTAGVGSVKCSAIVASGGSISWYLNASVAGTGSYASPTGTCTGFHIGDAGGGGYCALELGEFMIFGEALTAQNIQDIYDDYIVPKYGALA